jgi:hypothetical protein
LLGLGAVLFVVGRLIAKAGSSPASTAGNR